MLYLADSLNIIFQIRPKREFNAAKGYEQLLNLQLFAFLPNHNGNSLSSDTNMNCREETSEEPQNAYDFMKKRCPHTVDPSLQRWSAIIRMGNFSAVGPSSICV